MPAPIALFVYNRPAHTQKTIEALLQNDLSGQSDLIIFSDGAKGVSDEIGVRQVREYIGKIKGFNSVEVQNSPTNKGLAKSIITGVTEVLNRRENIIVLEDDLITSPYFLEFMNQALTLYEIEQQVISIHGYMYPVTANLPDTFFLKGADCWGWATWQRGWSMFEADGTKLLEELDRKQLARDFDFDNSHAYRNMLVDQVHGRNDSWAIRWYASAFLRDKLTLYPGNSLVSNIGNDSSGTHSGSSDIYEVSLRSTPVELKKVPIVESSEARAAIMAYFRSPRKLTIRKLFRAALALIRR